MRWPSINNENPLTWKCKVFGFKNEELPLTWYDSGEKHGIKFGKYTATKTYTKATFKGCIWCMNYKKLSEQEVEDWPKWTCSCEVCENHNENMV